MRRGRAAFAARTGTKRGKAQCGGVEVVSAPNLTGRGEIRTDAGKGFRRVPFQGRDFDDSGTVHESPRGVLLGELEVFLGGDVDECRSLCC